MADWRQSSGGFVETSVAVVAGHVPESREPIFVGRFNWGGGLIPGKIIHSYGCCFIPYEGQEIQQSIYEYLINPEVGYLSWVPATSGEIPPGAIVGGRTSTGEPLYVGRAMQDGDWIPGPIEQSKYAIRIPYDGKELLESQYQVLVMNYD